MTEKWGHAVIVTWGPSIGGDTGVRVAMLGVFGEAGGDTGKRSETFTFTFFLSKTKTV